MKVNFYQVLLGFSLFLVNSATYGNSCGSLPLDFERLKAGAEADNAYCQALLGSAYWRGAIVEVDMEQSLYWSRKAWEADEPLGHYNHGAFLKEDDWGLEKSVEGAKAAYKKAREGFEKDDAINDPHSLFSLAYILNNGSDGSDPDETKGCNLWKQAAEKGHTVANNNYGICLEDGDGNLEKDIQEAVKYYKKAASQGSSSSMNQLAKLYLKEGSSDMAFIYYQQAATKSPQYYALPLARLIESGFFPNQDSTKALEFYLMAAEKDITRAKYRAGLLLALGAEDIEIDHKRAELLLKEAAKAKDLDAINLLAAKEHWPSKTRETSE
ncbi:tetratricopeptide repeat protein [Pseudoalteromonas piscicida]